MTRRAVAMVVWIAVIALYLTLLGAAIVLAAELSLWAFTGTGHVTTAAAFSVGKETSCTRA
jgi:hypothetical protein